jgi:hypothetical protein
MQRRRCCCPIARYWPSKGSRNRAAKALAGGLIRAGKSEEQTQLFIRAVAEAAGDDDVENRVGTIQWTAQKWAKKEKINGWPDLAQVVGDDVVDSVLEWLEFSDVKDDKKRH